MDNRRKCVLTKLKTLLNLLEEDDAPRRSYVNVRNCCQEVPPCPAAHQKYPLVPYRPPKNQCYKIHGCSPSTMLCPPSRRNSGRFCGYNGTGDHYSRTPCRRKPRCASRKCPKYYYVDGTSCDVDVYATRSRISVKGPYIIPPRCTESMEIRGGTQHIGCACQKTNGLQDKCERFCCLANPCQRNYLRADQFEEPPQYSHFPSMDSDSRTIKIFDPEDETLVPSYPATTQNVSGRYHPYDYVTYMPVKVSNGYRSYHQDQDNFIDGNSKKIYGQSGIYDYQPSFCVVYPMNMNNSDW